LFTEPHTEYGPLKSQIRRVENSGMPRDSQHDRFHLGFLTAIEVPGRGFVGGLLVTNHYGRPLEFQCTTPVKPNRTQEILYGPTLVPYLLGELIGKTLVEKVGIKPDLVLTEEEQLLELRKYVSTAVACMDRDEKSSDAAAPNAPAAPADNVALGRNKLRFHAAHESDRQQVEQRAHLIPGDADLSEPFDRVREALKETTASNTQRTGS